MCYKCTNNFTNRVQTDKKQPHKFYDIVWIIYYNALIRSDLSTRVLVKDDDCDHLDGDHYILGVTPTLEEM